MHHCLACPPRSPHPAHPPAHGTGWWAQATRRGSPLPLWCRSAGSPRIAPAAVTGSAYRCPSRAPGSAAARHDRVAAAQTCHVLGQAFGLISHATCAFSHLSAPLTSLVKSSSKVVDPSHTGTRPPKRRAPLAGRGARAAAARRPAKAGAARLAEHLDSTRKHITRPGHGVAHAHPGCAAGDPGR
jgi:hypothetical protein